MSSFIDQIHPFSSNLIQEYQQNGHVYVPGLCPEPELAPYRAAINQTAAELNHETRSLEERDTYGKAFLQSINLWEHNQTVKAFTTAKRFASVAAALLGVPAVRLYHDQALFKEPGGGPTPWHQDQQYWPLTCNTVTMWMPLVDVTEHMGTMFFASGSHADGYLGHLPISDDSQQIIEDLVKTKGYKISPPRGMKAGDATFHSGWTLHGAPGNPGTYTREVMTVIYLPDNEVIGAADSQDRKNDLARFFPNLKEGDPAATPLNPLVFP